MDVKNVVENLTPTVPTVSAGKVYYEYPYTNGKVHQCHIAHGECEYCEYSSAAKLIPSIDILTQTDGYYDLYDIYYPLSDF